MDTIEENQQLKKQMAHLRLGVWFSCILAVISLSIRIWQSFNELPIINVHPAPLDIDGKGEVFRLSQWKPTDGLATVDEFASSNNLSTDDVLSAIISGQLEAYSFQFNSSGWLVPKHLKLSNPKEPRPRVILPPIPD